MEVRVSYNAWSDQLTVQFGEGANAYPLSIRDEIQVWFDYTQLWRRVEQRETEFPDVIMLEVRSFEAEDWKFLHGIFPDYLVSCMRDLYHTGKARQLPDLNQLDDSEVEEALRQGSFRGQVHLHDGELDKPRIFFAALECFMDSVEQRKLNC